MYHEGLQVLEEGLLGGLGDGADKALARFEIEAQGLVVDRVDAGNEAESLRR